MKGECRSPTRCDCLVAGEAKRGSGGRLVLSLDEGASWWYLQGPGTLGLRQ